MNVCGVLVHAQPECTNALIPKIENVPGAEFHGLGERGRMIVTLEDTAELSAADALSELHRLPGVIAAALVYHETDADVVPPDGRMNS